MSGSFISTEQLAEKLCVKPNTIRTNLCLKGHVYGLKPTKLPNGRLLWSADAVHALLNSEVPA